MAKKSAGRAEAGSSSIAKNRAAFHNYEVLQKLECGLVLTGTEVNSGYQPLFFLFKSKYIQSSIRCQP